MAGNANLYFDGTNLSVGGSLSLGSPLTVPNGGTGLTSLTSGYIPFGNGTGAFSSSSALYFDGTNLGIGAAASGGKLEVTGSGTVNLKVTSTSGNAQLILKSFGTYDGYINYGQGGAGGLVFYDSNAATERMHLFSSGGVSIGNTTDPGAGNLSVSGNILATGSVTAYYSDDRLKTKLGKIENALDKLCSLDGFYYEANETAQALGYKPEREVGVSAQKVQSVLPEIVAPAPIDNQYLTVKYERLAPLFIEAIKELRAEIEELKSRL